MDLLDPLDNEAYKAKWGLLVRLVLSVLKVLLVFLGFLARLDRPVRKGAWVLLGELVPWAVQELTVLQVRKVLQAPWGPTDLTALTEQRAREATLAMRQV